MNKARLVPGGTCCRHKHEYPCTCAMGHLYRFVEPVVLLMLKEKGHACGYELSGDLDRYAFTDSEIERAALYRTLRRLEEHGYVSSEWDVGELGPARRIYALTAQGKRHLQEWAQVLEKVASSMNAFVHRVDSLRNRQGALAGGKRAEIGSGTVPNSLKQDSTERFMSWMKNAPRLAKRLRTLKSDARHAILVKAFLFSAAMLGQLEAEVQDMLRSVEANGRLSSEEASKALALAEAEKDKSYALEEQNAPREKWVKPMSEACLLQAMVTAFGPDCEDDAAAVYELLDTQDHGSKLTGFIESEITAAVLE